MLNEMEYTFFDQKLAEQFSEACGQMGLNTEIDSGETFSGEPFANVKVTSEMDDKQANQLEDLYGDMLFGEPVARKTAKNTPSKEPEVSKVQIRLPSGSVSNVSIEADIMRKLQTVFTVEELKKFLEQVVYSAENPDQSPICSGK